PPQKEEAQAARALRKPCRRVVEELTARANGLLRRTQIAKRPDRTRSGRFNCLGLCLSGNWRRGGGHVDRLSRDERKESGLLLLNQNNLGLVGGRARMIVMEEGTIDVEPYVPVLPNDHCHLVRCRTGDHTAVDASPGELAL